MFNRHVSAALTLLLTSGPVALVAQDTALPDLLERLTFRQVGPAIMGGRVADLAVDETNPSTFYVGLATGGVWKTTSQGMHWEPLFDYESTASIGDVTLAPSNPNVVWVGTGEPQNRQSSPWGDGVYRSTDGGRTWTHLGLRETRHIARIVVHPADPDIAYVAAVGHLWGPNAERGVYRTVDGGTTWERILFVDEHTGAIDLAMDAGDPKTLFAAMYQRQRTAFGFSASGGGSGLYRTTDGGATWTELTVGLPEGEKGRIGIDVYRRDGNLVYTLVEARGADRGVYRSRDRGETWERVSGTNPRPMYFSQIRIDPNDPERIYIGGVQFGISDDGGRTFRSGDGAEGIHVDHHAIWIDPNDSNHLIIGNDGGIASTFDRGEHWRHHNNLAIGQFYEIGYDMRDPYYVCGGLQDNSTWCGPSRTLTEYGIRNRDWYDIAGGDGFYAVPDPADPRRVYAESQNGNVRRVDVLTGESVRLRPVERSDSVDYRWNWNTPVVISAHDPATVYIGANVLFTSHDRGASWSASPDLTRQIDRDTLEIMGARVTNQTLSRNDGVSAYGTITTISESPLDAGVLYVGADDGSVQVTRDGGATWTDRTDRFPDLPAHTYVSRIVASAHAPGRVYVTFDGHYDDDYRPFVYVSEDYGQRFRAVTDGLPDWSVNVIVEHHAVEHLLFVGTEIGIYVSSERGGRWHRMTGLPTVPVDDIKIHPRENDLIVGTHGRSIWILDDLSPLEVPARDLVARGAGLFPVRPVTMWAEAGGWPFDGDIYQAPNPPAGAIIRYYLGDDAPTTDNGDSTASTRLLIEDANGRPIRRLHGPATAGLHQLVWDLRHGAMDGDDDAPRGPPVLPGRYHVSLSVNGATTDRFIDVRPDPRSRATEADLVARHEALLDMWALAGPLRDAGERLEQLQSRVQELADLAEQDGVPVEIRTAVDSLDARLDGIEDALEDVQRTARVSGAIEGSFTRPTADQQWQIEDAWTRAPDVIRRLNAALTERLPALERRFDELGIHPSIGDPVPVPRRGG